MATSTQTLIVKLHFGTDIRRFTVNAQNIDSDLTWASLSERVARSFDLTKKFKVTYVDDEKDVITISTDDELKEAVALALTSEPSVLRLTVSKRDKLVAEAAKASEGPPAEAKPPADKKPEPRSPPLPGMPPELAPFLEAMAKQLPAAMANLPEGLKQMLPHAELDLAATVAANTPAGRQADPFCPADPHAAGAAAGVHEGVTCDKSGVCPIVGNRYHLVGHNYDLCEAEYLKLSDKEKSLFRKVVPPGAADDTPAAAAAPPANNVHPGVTCDRSGQSPIEGTRYHLRGHNYDLCQAEYDKLPDNEKGLYTALPPPDLGGGGPWRPGWGWRGGCGGKKWNGMGHGGHGHGGHGHGGHGHGGMGHGHGHGDGPKLAARFVRDVTIFDGTQMAPGTTFTKIWRLKNVGEVPWPPGARMLFVGGDQMTSEMSVPLSRASSVMPGEEVDVAVEMTAPTEHGRYLGYWRLTGPFMRRKFGQRVWCHVHVIDPNQSGVEAFDDLPSTLAEIERKKSDLAAADEPADDAADDELDAAKELSLAPAEAPPPSDAPAVDGSVDVSDATAKPVPADDQVNDDAPAADEASKDGSASDDGVLVTVDGDPASPAEDPAAEAAGPSDGVGGVRAELAAMGFVDPAMVDAVIEKNGGDVEASARDLAAATEWDHLLDDLAEMGFENRMLNTTLMLKNGGNMKRTVRDLVEA